MKQYVEVNSSQEADLLIFLGYILSDPDQRMYVSGYKGNTYTYYKTTYTKALYLSARSNEPGPQQGKQVWRVWATYTDESNDLTYTFPYLVIASQQYWGVDTKGKITKNIYEKEDVFSSWLEMVKKNQKK